MRILSPSSHTANIPFHFVGCDVPESKRNRLYISLDAKLSMPALCNKKLSLLLYRFLHLMSRSPPNHNIDPQTNYHNDNPIHHQPHGRIPSHFPPSRSPLSRRTIHLIQLPGRRTRTHTAARLMCRPILTLHYRPRVVVVFGGGAWQ